MSAPALAQMLSTMLYGKRFFPYFVWNTLGGLDENGAFGITQASDVYLVMIQLEIMKSQCTTVLGRLAI